MKAYYETIKAPIDEEIAMKLYVVYVRDIHYEQTHQLCNTSRMLNIYDKEETAIAVVNAINKGLL